MDETALADTVAACNALIDSRYSDNGDHGAAAMLLADGTILTGTAPDAFNPSVEVCHEIEPYCGGISAQPAHRRLRLSSPAVRRPHRRAEPLRCLPRTSRSPWPRCGRRRRSPSGPHRYRVEAPQRCAARLLDDRVSGRS